MNRYRCTVCNFIYDDRREKARMEDVPPSYNCPVCGAPKSAFAPEGPVAAAEGTRTAVADKIVDQLVELGVKHVYGIPGDSNLPIVDAIRRNDRIDFVLTRHEETAAFMACAHGKITGHIGVCISIAGPGSTNLITGLMDAANDRSPVLALLGQVPELYLGSEAFQEIDQIELFSPFAGFTETVARTGQALKLVVSAARYAYKGPGPSVLSLPTDVLMEKLSDDIFAAEKRVVRSPVGPDHDPVEKAAGLIDKASRVALLIGWGGRDAGTEIIRLAKKIGAAVATTSRAKGVIHETHPLSVGVLGSIGPKHAAQAVQKADLILIVGSGFRQANLVPPDITKIQIDRDPARLAKTFDLDAGLIGDAEPTLAALTESVAAKNANEAFHSELAALKEEHVEELERDAKDMSEPINPGLAIQMLKKHANKDAIICVDVGDHTYWFYKKFLCEGQRTFLSANIASMGFGLPAALSAKLDYPNTQVVCVTGDGGFGMLMADFTTAVREELEINVIVFNDGQLKNIRKEQNRDGYPEYGITFENPNFAQFAEDCGGLGVRVTNPHELDKAVSAAFSAKKPALVEILVDKEKMAPSTRSPD